MLKKCQTGQFNWFWWRLMTIFEINHCIMRNVFLLSLLLSIAGVTNAQNTAVATPAVELIQLKETSHDFGKIPQGRPASYVFEVVNTSKEPLKLDNVQASCGCTTPQWSHDPIAAGGTSKIIVGYNAFTEGYFEKTITITYNTNQTKVMTIKGTVYKAPPTPAPENASVKLLNGVNN